MLRYFALIFFLLWTISTSALCQQKIVKEFSYISDFAFNISGGKQTGFAWLSCFQASFHLNTGAMKLWKNGTFKFLYISTHGKSFSNLTGDIQIASNIEARQMASTLELWYQHKWNKLRVTFGLIDLNEFFSYSNAALSLVNSSFGIQPTISGNIPVPIFPISSVGVALEYMANGNTEMRLGIFDGSPSQMKEYQLLPDINWGINEGIFAIAEAKRLYQIGMKQGFIKAGYWLHSQNISSHHKGEYLVNHGFYAIGELEILKMKNRSLHVWGKFGGAPRDCNVIRFFNGGGISYTNIWGTNVNDVLGLGIGQALFCHEFKRLQLLSGNETVIELTARKELGILAIQPDLQYIINPSGDMSIENSLCFILRTSLTL